MSSRYHPNPLDPTKRYKVGRLCDSCLTAIGTGFVCVNSAIGNVDWCRACAEKQGIKLDSVTVVLAEAWTPRRQIVKGVRAPYGNGFRDYDDFGYNAAHKRREAK